MKMCHQGEMVYSAVDKRDFKLYKQYIKLDEKQAKTELLTRYYRFCGPATINDAAYFTKFKKTEIKDIMKILYLYSGEIEERMYYYYEEEGEEVSGGEAQKIALARALYKDSPFVVLDEPTAALDPISEYDIYSRFNELVEDKTSIFISHRMSSCRFCDDIIVFDKGNIIQRGTHNKLMEDTDNIYAHMWNAQAKYYI